jgi:Mg-chelatase subunit ChlI
MTSFIAAGGSGRCTSVIPAVPAASSVTTIAFIRHLPVSSSRRLTAKGRATRARIIDAAAQLTYENGAANTSFEDVRKAAKASGSSAAPR